jgi:repressor LexA
MADKRTIPSVFRDIEIFFRENRRMPTYGEMMEVLGVRSKSVVHFWVGKLLVAGLLVKDAGGFLKPAQTSPGLPWVGSVQAGFPSPAEEELRDVISLDEYLINRPDSSFLLSVQGDSMIGEGIKEGDLVIVERGREPHNGDIILAEVDGEWTMKYFRKEGGNVVLVAANPKYPPIHPRQELRVGGVITAVIRKYLR